MMWVLGGLAYFVCGVLAYGVIKGYFSSQEKKWANLWERFCSNALGARTSGFNLEKEFVCWVYASGGLLGLLMATLVTWSYGHPMRLCYKMPKELCQKETSRENRD